MSLPASAFVLNKPLTSLTWCKSLLRKRQRGEKQVFHVPGHRRPAFSRKALPIALLHAL